MRVETFFCDICKGQVNDNGIKQNVQIYLSELNTPHNHIWCGTVCDKCALNVTYNTILNKLITCAKDKFSKFQLIPWLKINIDYPERVDSL